MSFTHPSDPAFNPSAVGDPQPSPADPPAPSAEPEPVPAAPVDQPATPAAAVTTPAPVTVPEPSQPPANDAPSSNGPAKGDGVSHTSVDEYTGAEVHKIGVVLAVEEEIITVQWFDGGRASLHVDEFEVL